MRATAATQLDDDLADLFGSGHQGLDDRALLDRFREAGDERAFERLVIRHGPMVQGVCRRLLGDSHDADDAFQATWLVLVRKAGQIRDADRLGPWLYGVASRVASKARARKARRRESPPLTEAAAPGQNAPTSDFIDVPAILDTELGQISAKLRAVVVLCLLQGVTTEEASVRLRCPVGTVKSRLARGREALRDRLVRRGVAPSAAVALAPSSLASPVSATLIRATLSTITASPAAVAPGVAVLTRGVAPAMLTKSTVIVAVVLGGIMLAGNGMITRQWSLAQAKQPGTIEPRIDDRRLDDEKQLRNESISHMKQILLAFYFYNAKHDHFPAAAIYGPDGRPKLSWRVMILPQLGEVTLFNEFRQDEAWDSPHNKALIPRMPNLYTTPDSPTPSGQSRIRGFSGRGTMFEGTEGFTPNSVTDGLANTILFVSAKQAIEWTRPEEIPFVADHPLTVGDGNESAQLLIGCADGACRSLSTRDEPMLRKMITRNGGEVINFSESFAPPASPKTVVVGQANDLPTLPTSAIERRLQRVEDKLDLLLKKLDSQSGTRDR